MVAELVYKAIEASVTEVAKGGIVLKAPTTVGVKADKLPDGLRERLRTNQPVTKKIFTYRSYQAFFGHYSEVDQDGDGPQRKRADDPGPIDGEIYENVNLKLQCIAQWNGPEVWAQFDVAVDGMKSKMGADTIVDIKNQLDLRQLEAPEDWKKLGVKTFPVVYVPVSVVVDQLGLRDNFKASFQLVLSGMYGFGESASGAFQLNYQEVED